MSRFPSMFDRCRMRGEGALGGFLMLGDPGLAESGRAVDALVAGGADFLELGLPFSDPVADGPVIQAAATRALAAGVRTADGLALIEAIRHRHPAVPIGILTYANIAAARGFDRFVDALAGAGADALLVADIPSLEAAPYAAMARAAGLDWVMIAAPNSPLETLRRIAALGSGFTYCVARAGVTGDETVGFAHRPLLDELRRLGAAPPVLGFGISSPQAVAAALGEGAAGAISGTALVEALAVGGVTALAERVAGLKAATRPPLAIPA